MPRGSYRSYRYRSWGSSPPSKYTKLKRLFGTAVGEIKTQFFDLDQSALDELLSDYGEMYGKSAEDYARRTMPNWISGSTKLSGQTMERLIELVPPYLSARQRLSLLKLILDHNKKSPPTKTIKVNLKEPEVGLAEIDEAMTRLAVNQDFANLPSSVMDAASWLCDDDVTVARALVTDVARIETESLKVSAKREIDLLKRTLRSGQIKAASYTVQTPGGNINIIAYTPSLCFVATKCFGSTDQRTEILRSLRDNCLVNFANGRRFLVWYYNNGEQISKNLEKHPTAMVITKVALTIFTLLLQKLNIFTR